MQGFQALRDYPLVMAIDFGIKETRVGYALNGDYRDIIDLHRWPRDSRSIGSAMSVSLYKKDSTEIMDWGYKAHLEKMKPTGSQYCLLRNLKLHLYGTMELPPFDIPITLLQAVTDYLRMVHEYAMQEAMRGRNFLPDHFRYCLTVPARWSDRSKEIMRQAAIEAGLVKASDTPHRLRLISEDEAKALYCLRMTDQFEFKDKDRFLVCTTYEDSEGVDLSMFEVGESSAGRQARRLKEVAHSHGTVCVSAVLDRNMRRLLEDKLRSYLSSMPVSGIGKLVEIFRDTVQPCFDGIEDQFIQIPAEIGLDGDDEDAGLDDGYIILMASELRAVVFDPAVTIVLELIWGFLQQQKRLGGNCKVLYMFGEFGSSGYMYKRVCQEFKGQLELISIPPRPELGTIRGAVFAGMSPNAVEGFHPKPTSEQSSHHALSSIPVLISPAPTPSSTTTLQTTGSVHSMPTLPVDNQAPQDKDGRHDVRHHQQRQQHQQQSTTLGYLPPPQPPALTGRGAGHYQQTLRAPQTQTHTHTSALASTPATKINGLAPYSYPIVMAFDFGEKFTKVSYAFKGSAEICDIDTRLNTTKYIRYGWAPAVSSYKKGSTEIQGWGYKAYAEVAKSPKDYCMLRNFRLQLDETIEVPPFENGFTPLKVITDYLRKLHEYAVEEVLKNMSSEFKSDTFQYVLTVPARWSNRSRNTMRQAAIGAGLVEAGDPSNRLMVLTEDDANAMYCLRKIDGIQFKDKDRFIMCDASEGGGVDVVVYEVGESSAGQAQRLQEVARTHSSDCGSDFLEANIETYLERKLRKHRKIITARAWGLLMHDFWNVVRVIFKPAYDEEYIYLPFPSGTIPEYDPDIGLEDGVICFSREDLTEVFEPATADVLEVIWDQLQKQEQVGRACRAVFMLGEFGSCPYMLDRACQEFKEQVELVTAPPIPDLANVHGAVYTGLDSYPSSKR